MLKRKNEESEENTAKRVALDSEAVEKKDIEEDKQKTSVPLDASKNPSGENGLNPGEDSSRPETNESDNKDNTNSKDTISAEFSHEAENVNMNDEKIEEGNNERNEDEEMASNDGNDDSKNGEGSKEEGQEGSKDQLSVAGPISSHRVVHDDDPTYVHFRMLCTISEAATVVGKGGETIKKIKELSNARINVSDNLKGVPERVISVRGPAEYVAKAFGLIVRMQLGEPLNVPSSLESQQYNLRLLFPHTIMGYIIGKKGSRFREIEESSAAALKANDQILPASTDRVLNINGVADAIHIATYYIAQTVIEHKQQMSKAIYYNPANFAQPTIPLVNSSARRFQHRMMGDFRGGRMGRQFGPQPGFGPMMGMPSQMMGMYGQMSPQGNANSQSPESGDGQSNMGRIPGGKPPQMGGYFPPQYAPQFNPAAVASNTRAETVTTGADGKLNQDIFVPQKHIGLIIGRGGRNLKDIRQQTGCYVKINDEVPGSTERKLTLMSNNMYGIQNALLLINNKIENEKMREQRGQRREGSPDRQQGIEGKNS